MTGSPTYHVDPTEKFERSFTALTRRYRKNPSGLAAFEALLKETVEHLSRDPRPRLARPEPWPKGEHVQGCELRKISFHLPGLRGAVREGRLIYLVDDTTNPPVVALLWIYTHEDFKKRPPDSEIRNVIRRARSSR